MPVEAIMSDARWTIPFLLAAFGCLRPPPPWDGPDPEDGDVVMDSAADADADTDADTDTDADADTDTDTADSELEDTGEACGG